MTEIAFKMSGMDRTLDFSVELPKHLRKHTKIIARRFAMAVANTARALAPKDTGALKESIKVIRLPSTKNRFVWTVSTNERAAVPQELGFKPHSVYIRNSAKLTPGWYFVRKNTPFMAPAFNFEYTRHKELMDIAITKAIRGASNK